VGVLRREVSGAARVGGVGIGGPDLGGRMSRSAELFFLFSAFNFLTWFRSYVDPGRYSASSA
jgi:hypothetical protein